MEHDHILMDGVFSKSGQAALLENVVLKKKRLYLFISVLYNLINEAL